MPSSHKTAEIVAGATGIAFERVAHHLRALREAGLISPTARGRYATKLANHEVARVLLAVLASTLVKDAERIATNLAEMDAWKRSRRFTPSVRLDPSFEKRLPPIPDRVDDAVVELLLRLKSSKLFLRPVGEEFLEAPAKPDSGSEFAIVAITSRWDEEAATYYAMRASVVFGVYGLYSVGWTYRAVEDKTAKPWTRHPRSVTGGLTREDSIGLRALEKIAYGLTEGD